MASGKPSTEPSGRSCASRAYASIPGKREYISRISALSVDFEQVRIVSRRRGVSSSGSATRASCVDGSTAVRRQPRPPSFPLKENSWVLDPADQGEPYHPTTLLQKDFQCSPLSSKSLSFGEGASLLPKAPSREQAAQGHSPQQSNRAFRLSPKSSRVSSDSNGATDRPLTTPATKPASSRQVTQSLTSHTLPKKPASTLKVANGGISPFSAGEERVPGDGCEKDHWPDEDVLEEDPDVLSDLDQEESEEEEEEEEEDGVFLSDNYSNGGLPRRGVEGWGALLRKVSSSDSSGVWSDASTQDHHSRGLWHSSGEEGG